MVQRFWVRFSKGRIHTMLWRWKKPLSLWLSTEAVAFFSLPILSLFSLPACSLVSSCIVILERLSLHCSSKPQNWKIMDLINWSLNAIDTISRREARARGSLIVLTETYPAGYTMDAWDRWRIVCLAALSVEDIEDIYLFGTMITGLLLIGLGFALGYRRIKEREQLFKASQGCPSWLKQWAERSALRLRLLTAIWILSRKSSRLCKEKLTETRTDNES